VDYAEALFMKHALETTDSIAGRFMAVLNFAYLAD
jgi:hypothetical protein